MDAQGSVTLWIQDLRSDDRQVRELAIEKIWMRYVQNLLAFARANLDRRVRRREDEEDVLQGMFNSFCLLLDKGDLDLSGRDELWRLLVTITVRKARNTVKSHRRKRRDVAREYNLTYGDSVRSAESLLRQIGTMSPSPAEAAVLNEALERRLSSLVDPGLRQVALLRLEGNSNREIAELLGCTERSVERKLRLIRSAWLLYDDDGTNERG